MKIHRFIRLLLLAFLCNAATAHAGGFQVNLQGQKQGGMGHCGTALLLGASSAFFNPGAFAFADSNGLAIGASFVMARVQYLAAHPSTYTAETNSGIGTPITLYANYKPHKAERWNFGLAVYTPFGSGISYRDDWLGQFVMREMSLRTIFTQPTVGFRVSDHMGIGAGYVYGTGNFLMRRGIPVQFLDGTYGAALLSGKGAGQGFNAGVYIRPLDALSIGLSYRSTLKVRMEDGLAEFSVPSALADSFPATTFSTSITLPKVISAGLAYRCTEKLLIALDYNYVGWSVYDTLAFDFEMNTENLEDIASARMYRNSMIFRLGAQFELSENLSLRAGAYYDFTPVQQGYLTPETPDNDKLGLTAGWTWRGGAHFRLNTSFIYLWSAARTDTNLESGFGGTWQSTAFIPGIGLEYIF